MNLAAAGLTVCGLNLGGAWGNERPQGFSGRPGPLLGQGDLGAPGGRGVLPSGREIAMGRHKDIVDGRPWHLEPAICPGRQMAQIESKTSQVVVHPLDRA